MKDEVPDLEVFIPINQLVDFTNDELRAAVPFNVLVNVEIHLQKCEPKQKLAV